MRAGVRASVTLLLLLWGAPAWGQPTPPQQKPEENLSEKIINPIAFLTKMTVENKYSPSLWGTPGDENLVEGVLTISSKIFAKPNLARIKIFFDTSESDGSRGLSEAEIFDLVLFDRSWGTLGAGISVQLNSQSKDSNGTAAAGRQLAPSSNTENGNMASSTRIS
jgi:hypothetical protein